MTPDKQIELDTNNARHLEAEADSQQSKDRKLADHTRVIARAYKARAEYVKSRTDG